MLKKIITFLTSFIGGILLAGMAAWMTMLIYAVLDLPRAEEKFVTNEFFIIFIVYLCLYFGKKIIK
jgi:hypothetical protein